MAHNPEKKQLVEVDPYVIYMLELANMNFKATIINISMAQWKKGSHDE